MKYCIFYIFHIFCRSGVEIVEHVDAGVDIPLEDWTENDEREQDANRSEKGDDWPNIVQENGRTYTELQNVTGSRAQVLGHSSQNVVYEYFFENKRNDLWRYVCED